MKILTNWFFHQANIRVALKIIMQFFTGLFCIWTCISFAAEPKLSFATKEITAYPFLASKERAMLIRSNYKRVAIGMSSADVRAILDDPDEIRPFYEPVIKNGKLLGYTYWYVIRRLVPNGSINEKKEVLVRISFNLNDQVSRIDGWGLGKNN